MYRNLLTAVDWQARSVCRDEDPELFFPIGETGPSALQIEEAKAVCALCPVVEPCLRWAMDTREVYGIWGGTTEADRRLLHHRAARANPRAAAGPGVAAQV
ncbi:MULTISPECIES: WhiB family transcriptional regulator [Streptomyces]|uniref:Transcriptional regulator WhiB n=1 Tax=Streptomyces flaveolus TaxID=67297 RepID=A0ABV3AGR1_9ACTN|nr:MULTISPECIES: WhiB family transcriptional regulator [Streptomyces]KOV92012.1 WhiB family transcriptional regulator [Streptomyces sp. NRRL WC-3723]